MVRLTISENAAALRVAQSETGIAAYGRRVAVWTFDMCDDVLPLDGVGYFGPNYSHS